MAKIIRVLYVVSSLKKCGPTNQLFGIISNLNKKTFKVNVLTLFREENDSDMDKFIESGIKVNSLSISNKFNYVASIIGLKKYLKKKNFDIVHSSGLAADISCCFQKESLHVSTIRNYGKIDYRSLYNPIISNVMAYINKWAIKHTDYPICCSKAIMNMYEKDIDKKLSYIQNGVDISKYRYDENSRNIIREKLEISNDKVVFISSGSLIDRKDPVFIIEQFKNLKSCDKWHLIIIGDGYLYEKIKAHESNNITVLGKVNDVVPYLSASDVYISASKSEGLPNSVLEAGSIGLKMILSSIPQHKEIFHDDIVGVWFFDLDDATKFNTVINEVLNNGEDVSEEISHHVKIKFSSQANSEQYQKKYKKIIQGK